MSPKQPSLLIEGRQIRAGDTSRVPCCSGRNVTPKLISRQQSPAHRLWKGSAQNNPPLLLLARSTGQRSHFNPNKHAHPRSLLTNKHQNTVERQEAMDISWNTRIFNVVYRKKLSPQQWSNTGRAAQRGSPSSDADAAPHNLPRLNTPQAGGLTRPPGPFPPKAFSITKLTWDVLIKGYSRKPGKAKREHSLTLKEGKSVAHNKEKRDILVIYTIRTDVLHQERGSPHLHLPKILSVTEPTSQEKPEESQTDSNTLPKPMGFTSFPSYRTPVCLTGWQ